MYCMMVFWEKIFLKIQFEKNWLLCMPNLIWKFLMFTTQSSYRNMNILREKSIFVISTMYMIVSPHFGMFYPS